MVRINGLPLFGVIGVMGLFMVDEAFVDVF
jgi:hypothetical protein